MCVDTDSVPGAEEIAEVRDFWSELGVPGLVDVHTHFMPKSVMDKVWGYFDSAGPMIGRPWPITYRLVEEERVHRLREFGVRAFTSMIYPHKNAMAEWLNQWAVEFAAQTPDCLHTATFYPEETAASYVGKALESGRESSSPTSRSGTTIRTIRCSTRCGAARGLRDAHRDPLWIGTGAGKVHGTRSYCFSVGALPATAADHRAHGNA